ncbi:hypothetical protein Ga0061061_11617 [Chelatococcus sambhunathii]|uniref:Uncharacterized protein n=1 Tax=Chelatococcus sambhunathii TaxID=363953 RepID=A0ABP2A8Q3_9HYPH|nr:hypothetical protein [Chelatococcus sambhunathii]CUA90858.1 hypothetical protein Ga0061061_11617 [Chelatococcus sambhunathii]
MTLFRMRAHALAEAYRAVKGNTRAPAAIVLGRWDKVDGYLVGRNDMRCAKWATLVEFFAENWPEEAKWPSDVPHPASAISWRPVEMLELVVPAYCRAQNEALASVSGKALSDGTRLGKFLGGVQDMYTDSAATALAFCAKHWPEGAAEQWPAEVPFPTDLSNVPPNARRPRGGAAAIAG